MMFARRTRIWALLCLAMFLNIAVAGVIGPYHRRQDVSPTTTEAPKTTISDGEGARATASPERSATRSSAADITSSVTSTISDTPVPSAINGNNPSNNSIYISTIAAGELPLQPQLTPGWGVAGALLLLTGIVYALIGIKNAWLHTFFSAAYLASLSVTVLIIYVMVPPIPIAIQGAYVVAIVCTGLILGGAATVFRELTEGLGCLLGGFCVAMWLLTLGEGGLVQSSTGKIIFIIAFTAAGYAFYFSRYTRPYALITMMSFSGATVTVLGIDCFSLAGLKEFWAYIWNLNDKVFPFGADTYPMTKGIRVEVALIVVMTIPGVISQLKLWRVIQQHRTKRAEARAEDQKNREEEEANVGRQVEEETARDRRQWEMVYGDEARTSSQGSGDSGVGYVDPEKKDHFSETQTTIKRVSSEKDEVEMAELTVSNAPEPPEPSAQAANGLMVTDKEEDSRVTVRVARDGIPYNEDDLAPMPEPDEKEWMATGTDGGSRRESGVSPRSSHRFSRPMTLEVTPLPFRIPDLNEEERENNDDDRSSFATFADEESKRASMGSLLMNRLSAGSGHIFRGLSQRPLKSKRKTGEFEMPQASPEGGESIEGLVSADQRPDDAESIAATVDGMSMGANSVLGLGQEDEKRRTRDIKAELRDPISKREPSLENEHVSQENLTTLGDGLDARHFSTADTVAMDIQEMSVLDDPADNKSKRGSTINGFDSTAGIQETANTATEAPGAEARSRSSNDPKSASPSVSSGSVSLTKDRLPSALPRVALSYRTNEWAKHLGLAEAPEMEKLQLNEYPEQEATTARQEAEAAVPVNVEELQQTAESGVPPTTIRRSGSSISTSPSPPVPVYRTVSRVSQTPALSRAHVPSTIMTPPEEALGTGAQTSPVGTGQNIRFKGQQRQSSDTYIQPIKEEDDSNSTNNNSPHSGGQASRRNSSDSMRSSNVSGPASRPPIPGVVSYSSPQTLLGRREMYLRNKSQPALFTPPAPGHENPQYGALRPASQLDLLGRQQQQLPPPPSPYVAIRDADDLPLSQRKELMRQSSLPAQQLTLPRQNSTPSLAQIVPGARLSSTPLPSAETTAQQQQFDSHQPQRYSAVPPRAAREARLASFRQSVAADLITARAASSGNININGETMTATMTPMDYSAADQQRSAMLAQREQEAQRREVERRDKERSERAFEERMRRGDLMGAHRDAMRRMQGSVRDR
ncbi:hypothetical protein F5X99DRAFT_238359 [Biscogniauxia marginata]|nr:hypothetical protein F5X99DRAFT_238359 [Biscogniauxia marginata]